MKKSLIFVFVAFVGSFFLLQANGGEKNENMARLEMIFNKIVEGVSSNKGRPPVCLSQGEVAPFLEDGLKSKMRVLEKTYSELWSLYDLAEKKKCELSGLYVVEDGNVPKDLIFFQNTQFPTRIELISISVGDDEAEIVARLKHQGDDDKKVWANYSEMTSMYFALINGNWALREIVFKSENNKNSVRTLTRILEVKSDCNEGVIRKWRSELGVSN